jgi:hypothetical protein
MTSVEDAHRDLSPTPIPITRIKPPKGDEPPAPPWGKLQLTSFFKLIIYF